MYLSNRQIVIVLITSILLGLVQTVQTNMYDGFLMCLILFILFSAMTDISNTSPD